MEKIRWGVLGTADIARQQTIPGMREAENCALYAIAGRSIEKARQYQAEFGFEKAYGSYDALLSDPAVQAVYVPLPNDLHREWAIRALEAKKHVLCEKPLALTEAQARDMFRAAEENGVHLMEAYAYLHNPFVRAVKAEVDAGAIGNVLYLESAFVGGPPREGNYRARRDAGGGAQYDLGCYPLSMALWMLDGEPLRVSASALFDDGGIDLATNALLSFAGGAVANLSCGMLLRADRLDRFRLCGDRGEIFSAFQFNQPGEIAYTLVRDGRAEEKRVTAPQNYRLEVEQLGRCILEGEAPAVSPAFSLRVARVQDRILDAIGFWK
ncbi:MAG: Gfo/Idh/MocA family oxidoreductase [Clostridiales bacterium]|nr:Gfo/Idh/MocA family oxidoreductase [Clostridiales bacterium]